jgi:hypothetical protein
MVIGIRQRIVEDMERQSSQLNEEDDLDSNTRLGRNGSSAEALSKFTDYSKSSDLHSIVYD